MAKNNKKPVPMKTKSIIGVFSLLGVFVVGLGMLAVTQRASQQETDNQTKAAYFQCQEYQLTQMYYRGNQGWVRNVPIAGGRELWNQGEQFRMFMDLNANPNALPGTGEIKDISYELYGSEPTDLELQLVRGDKSYYKYIQNSAKGNLDWASLLQGNWEDYGTGYGEWQAFGDFSIRNTDNSVNKKVMYYRTIYIGNKGYIADGYKVFNPQHQVIEERNGRPAITVENKNLVIDLNAKPSAIPGSGPVQAIGDYVSQDNTVLNQVWYRGNIGYMRQVPIRDYKPDYGSATPIQAVVDLNKTPNALPGNGEMQATTNFVSCKK